MNHDDVFTVDGDTNDLINRVIKRVDTQAGKECVTIDLLSLYMDLRACHNDCPMDFERLLAASESDFWHDISGIIRHMDRETGKLSPDFQPRYAVIEEVGNG